MKKMFISIVVVSFAVFSLNSTASIVWSGVQNQKAALDITNFDVNEDGTIDFVFTWGDQDTRTSFDPADGNACIGINDPFFPGIFDFVPFSAGFVIEQSTQNPNYLWKSGADVLVASALFGSDVSYAGSLANTNGYLGISFVVDGSAHYGWVQMSHDGNLSYPNSDYVFIHAWAYESEADTPIVTGAIPEPSSGILVVVGALSVWQLRRSRRRTRPEHVPHCSPTPGR